MGTGVVHVVGAGPGAADLITVRGRDLLHRADVIICDSLVPRTFLDGLGIEAADKDVRWLDPRDTRDRQDEISRWMLAAAEAGKTVVRLKGGDPLVFGRAAEELVGLVRAGVPYEVVPGLSACPAAMTAAGLPATWRGSGRSFAVVTARTARGTNAADLPRADTLAAFMAVRSLDEFVGRLLADRWPDDTPAVLIERATMPWERRVWAPLRDIAEAARREGIAPPALLAVGEGVRAWRALPQRPVILYTGLDPTSFRWLGDVLHWPAIAVVENEGAGRATEAAVRGLRAGRFRWVVFTSPRSVRAFFRELNRRSLDSRLLAGCRVAAAGPGTQRELEHCGIRADAVAREPGGAGLAEMLGPAKDGELLLLQGTHAPRRMTEALQCLGWRVQRVAQYHVVPHPELGRPLPRHDVIYFASPSAVCAYGSAYGCDAFRQEVWCIGDVTLRQLAGLSVTAKVVTPYVPANQNETRSSV